MCLEIIPKLYFGTDLLYIDFPGGSDGKASCLQHGRPGFDPWVGKMLWRRKWQPTLVLLPGKSHEQRSLVGYSPWGRKEPDTTEQLHFHFSIHHNSYCAASTSTENRKKKSIYGKPEMWGHWFGASSCCCSVTKSCSDPLPCVQMLTPIQMDPMWIQSNPDWIQM